MKNVKTLLEEQGARLEDICKITVYITDRAYREPVYRVVGKWLKGVFPVSTGLIVQGLARPEWVMEIDAWAVIPEERARTRPRPSPSRRGAPEGEGAHDLLPHRPLRRDRHARGGHHHLQHLRRQPLPLGAGRRRCGFDPERHRPHHRAARSST